MHRTKRLAIAGLLLVLAGCEKRAVVVQRVQSQRELNTILVYFARLGLGPVEVVAHEARREKWWEIRIPEPQLETARQLLVALDLPRPREHDEAASSSLIPSPDELAQQARRRLQRKLEAALEMYDGVVRAQVLIAPARRDEMTQKLTQPPSASVVVRYVADARRDTNTAPPVQAEQVQQIVAGAVPALEPEQVQVSFAPVVLPERIGPRIATPADAAVPGGRRERVRALLRRYQLPIAGGLVALALACVAVPLAWRRPRAAVAAEH